MRLKPKLLLTFSAVLIFPLITLGVLNHLQVKRAIQEQIISERHMSILNQAREIKLRIYLSTKLLLLLRNLPSIKGMIRAQKSGIDPLTENTQEQWARQFKSIVLKLTEIDDDVDDLRFINAQGEELILYSHDNGTTIKAIPPNLQPMKRHFRDTFKNTPQLLKAGNVDMSPIFVTREGARRKAKILVATPIFSKNGSREGIITLSMNVTTILDQIDKIAFGYILLIDKDGSIIYQSQKQKNLISPEKANFFEAHPELKTILANRDFKDHYDAHENQHQIWRKIYYDPSDHNKYWLLSSIIPYETLLAPFQHFWNRLISFCLLIVIIGTIIVWFLADTISRPLKHLSEWISSTGKGNLTSGPILALDRRDEIGELARSFNEMTQSLTEMMTAKEKTRQALARLNQGLEQKVSDRTKKLSDALAQQRELSDMKSRFVSLASHEFRTPLTGILTSATLLSHYNNSSQKDKRSQYIQGIKKSAHNLIGILNEFLSVDELDQKKIKCSPTTFSLDIFVREVVKNIKCLSKQGQHILYKHIGNTTQVVLDKERLRCVLTNLLTNAIKYSPEKSDIYFITESQNSKIRFIVEDHGMGIPEIDQKHLFKRFFRAKNALTIQGSGLGLNIIKGYVDIMGGTIQFTSKENTGSTFTVTFPKEIAA